MNKESKIYVAGHRGLVGSAIVRKLESKGYTNIITRTHVELDLTNQQATNSFFEQEKPEYVILAAAKVGGIMANKTYPAEFIYENLQIATNVIHAAHKNKVKKLINLGSSCIYPKFAKQPIPETELLKSELEPTNEAYAIAKIAAVKLCKYYAEQYGDDFISLMPTNLYGPNDNYDLQNSHVLPALIRRFYEAKKEKKDSITLWGTGSPMREFLHSDDLADAIVFILKNCTVKNVQEVINVGTGVDVTIKELAQTIQKEIGFEGTIEWDTSKPDGTPKKQLDVTQLHNLGWKHKISLEEGIKRTVKEFIQKHQ